MTLPWGMRPLAGLCLIVAAASAFAGDSTTWTARFNAYHARYAAEFGSDAYFSNSNNLGWGESYVQLGLLDLYALTGDPSYLDRFARRADRMFAVASDLDGDGRLGWGTFDLAVPLARNQKFEVVDPNDASLPQHWRRSVPAPGSAFRDPNAAYPAGSGFGVTLAASSNVLAPGMETTLRNDSTGLRGTDAYVPGALYQVWWHGRATVGIATGEVAAIDASTGAVLAKGRFRDRSWRYNSFRFRAPQASGHEIVIRLTASSTSFTGGSVQVDNVYVQQYSEYLAHDGQIAVPLLKAARLIGSDSALINRVVDGRTLGYRAQVWREFVRDVLAPKWRANLVSQANGDLVYVAPNDGSTAFPNQTHPTNINMIAASMHTALGTGEDRTIAEEIGRTFERRFQLVGDRYLWNYFYNVGPDDRPTNTYEDVSHGNLSVEFAISADEADLGLAGPGELFDPWKVQRFSETFLEALWNRSTTDPKLCWSVFGERGTDQPRSQTSGWVALSPYAMDVWRVVDQLYEVQRYWDYDLASPNRHRASILLTMARLARWADLRNGGMEAPDPDDPTLPLGWSRFQATTATAHLTDDSALGSRAAVVSTSPRMGRQILEHRFAAYPLGRTARFTFVAKTSLPQPGGVVEVVNCSTGEVLGRTRVTTPFFSSHVLQFRTPSRSNQDLRLRVGYSDWTVRSASVTIDGVRFEG